MLDGRQPGMDVWRGFGGRHLGLLEALGSLPFAALGDLRFSPVEPVPHLVQDHVERVLAGDDETVD